MFARTLIAAAFIALSTSAFAQNLSVATVNMESVFHGYHKTKAADSKLKEQREVYRNYAVNLGKEIQDLRGQMQQLIDDAQNIVLSDEIRKQKAEEATGVRRTLIEKQREFEEYQKDRMGKLQEEYQKERDLIVEEIQKVIADMAAAKGYDLVMDTSGRTFNQLPSIVFSKAEFEITETVLAKLNEGQPAAPAEEAKQ